MWESPGHKTRFYNFDCFDDRQYVSGNKDVWGVGSGQAPTCEISEPIENSEPSSDIIASVNGFS